MTTDKHSSSLAGNRQDNLEIITGIGLKTAEALSHIGIHRFADLAQSTPEELAKALLDQRGFRVSPKHIEAQNWIGQAQAVLQLAKDEQVTPYPNPEVEREPMKTQALKNILHETQWYQHAGFSLFFDYGLDGEGNQSCQTRVWQTRIYHDETAEEVLFPSTATGQWVNWILQHADLASDVDLETTKQRTSPSLASVTPSAAQVSILDVSVELRAMPDIRNKMLVTSVQFTVSGVNAEMFTVDSIPYQILLLTVDQDRGLTQLVASEHGLFQPEQAVYTHRLEFPLLDLGRYELQTIVLIQAKIELLAIHRGPTLKVIP